MNTNFDVWTPLLPGATFDNAQRPRELNIVVTAGPGFAPNEFTLTGKDDLGNIFVLKDNNAQYLKVGPTILAQAPSAYTIPMVAGMNDLNNDWITLATTDPTWIALQTVLAGMPTLKMCQVQYNVKITTLTPPGTFGQTELFLAGNRQIFVENNPTLGPVLTSYTFTSKRTVVYPIPPSPTGLIPGPSADGINFAIFWPGAVGQMVEVSVGLSDIVAWL